jgi:hypothetical protein
MPQSVLAVVWLVTVGAPLLAAACAWLWLQVCGALFIPGAFLAIPAYLVQLALAIYATPARWVLGERACFVAGEREIVQGLPCNAFSWLAVAACYTLVLGLVALGVRALGRTRT